MKPPAPLTFATPEEWNFWLSMRHDKAAEAWLRIARKSTGTASITWEQALEEALVWGWTDAQGKPDGPEHMLHRFIPRRPASPWSPKARAMAERLIAGGWMEAPGRAEVARAQADGRWDAALAPGKAPDLPDDVLAALAAAPDGARTAFAALPAKSLGALAFRLATAKGPKVRARRIADFIAALTPPPPR